MKIVTVLGARPQFIKAGSVSREIVRRKGEGLPVDEVIIHTGQHYDSNMSDIFFEEMHIPKPDYFLGVGGNSHGAMTGQMIEKIEQVLIEERPEWLLVYGDTNSTLAGAVVASKMNIKLAHVEAGLRSFNMRMPEEVNRILTDRVSALLFCPTQCAVNNLNKEGIQSWGNNAKIVLSGDVMKDGADFYKTYAQKPVAVGLSPDFVLCTIHRAENTDDPDRLGFILSALNEIAITTQVVIPMHPRTKNLIEAEQYDTSHLTVIDPVGYLNMIWLLGNCSLVMTDSGGLQKEAFFFKKPCITLRDETEWIELVENGFNILAGADSRKILDVYHNGKFSHDFDANLYGSGRASQIVVEELLSAA